MEKILQQSADEKLAPLSCAFASKRRSLTASLLRVFFYVPSLLYNCSFVCVSPHRCRRLLKDKIIDLKKELGGVRRHRDLQRRGRRKMGLPEVALVGYTNAGKSTLLNTLTRAGVMAENMLFATLDPTTRKVKLSGLKVLHRYITLLCFILFQCLQSSDMLILFYVMSYPACRHACCCSGFLPTLPSRRGRDRTGSTLASSAITIVCLAFCSLSAALTL